MALAPPIRRGSPQVSASTSLCSSATHRRCRDSVGSAPRRPGCAHSSSWLVALDGLSKPGPCRVRRPLRHAGEVMLGGFGFPVLLNLSAGLDIAVVGVFPWDRRVLRLVEDYGVPLHIHERPLPP